VKNTEKEKIVGEYLENKKVDLDFHAKRNALFVNLNLSFEKMLGALDSHFMKELMFMFIHDILLIKIECAVLNQKKARSVSSVTR